MCCSPTSSARRFWPTSRVFWTADHARESEMRDVHDDASMDARVSRRGVGFFITSRTLSIIGDMAALTALSVYIYTAFGSATMVSGLFVVRVLPRLFGPLAGAVAD